MAALIVGMLMPVASALSVSISPSSANSFYGNTIDFNAIVSGGSGSYTYQWSINGNPGGATSNNIFAYTPPTSGTFSVNVLVTDNGISPLQPVTSNPPIQYYANNALGFVESATPITTGNSLYGVSQVKNSDGSITTNVFSDNAPFEVSSDVAVYYGPLSSLNNFTVSLSNSQFSGSATADLNIWFDNNTADDEASGNPFFAWNSANAFTSVGGDAYALCSSGSCSGQNSILSFTGNTMFYLVNGYSGTYNFNALQLSDGTVGTIGPNTMATIDIVFDVPSGTTGSANAIIGTPQYHWHLLRRQLPMRN